MFQKSDFGIGQVDGAGSVALDAFVRPARAPHKLPHKPAQKPTWREAISDWAHRVDLTPDLGRAPFSRTWWRGLATCTTLCTTVLLAAPGFDPLPGHSRAPLSEVQFDQLRSQMITPLALGADTGGRMGPTDAVAALTHTPERPTISLDAVIGVGDSFGRMLQRAGVSGRDASAVLGLVGNAVDPDSIQPGTRVGVTLGRRASRAMPRPLDALSVRARLDLALEIRRENGALSIRELPIAVDDTPLRIRGRVGGSLYASARAAGADPSTIQAYLKVLAQQTSVETGVASDDRFDIVVAHRRAATGETETGKLLFAGLDRASGKALNMLRWTIQGQDQWFEASGVGQRRGMMAAPVAGRMTSSFGMRYHPILGYSRMHAGVDFGAAWGSPIYAATSGRVAFAGRHGGHGNYVRLDHGSGIGTGYGHMSRIAAHVGDYVRQGQVIGYVGSTGLSTGPHLHYEVYRGGVPINPLSVKFAQTSQLSGQALAAFKAKLAALKGLPVGLPTAAFASAQMR
ncbi:M23 family metallopeptidase [Sphingobium sufflavum]|uniref:peptidoglycan DD-metalloendopeptidase family protein n=1 Tax=Sphingobium sufflavum TaxID=1129547 RepID=UPI001F373CD9|nr:M23 family metallopeptidase [Sphingobium sufflavum]MCE7797667.1 M23 family metallopeptidase [Sphingobium sufflavum]